MRDSNAERANRPLVAWPIVDAIGIAGVENRFDEHRRARQPQKFPLNAE